MATKVVTGLVRLSYVNIFKSRSFSEGQDAKYSVCVLIPKDDKKTLKAIRAAMTEMMREQMKQKSTKTCTS